MKLVITSALSVFGVRSQYEQPRYKVLEYVGSVEVRAYGRRLAAEATVQAPDEAAGRDGAFKILAAYIFGQNRAAAGAAASPGAPQEIAMTAPVEAGFEPSGAGREIAMTTPVESASAPGGFTLRFFLPGDLTLSTAPTPLDRRVRLLELPEQTLAVLAWSGRGSADAVSRRKRDLLDALRSSTWRPAAEPVALFYDPPFTLPFLRRNEVAVAVEQVGRAAAARA